MNFDFSHTDSVNMVAFATALGDFPAIEKAFLDTAQSNNNGVTVSIKPLVYERTREQENYYRKWCGEFAKFCGYSADEIHDVMLRECFGSDEFKGRYGVVYRPRKRSGGTSRGEYSELIETLFRLTAEQGFVIPPAQRKIEHDV